MNMTRWAYFCTWAGTGDAAGAARAFLAEASEDAAAHLLDAAQWRDEDVVDFEHRGGAVLIDGRWGRFWLAPSDLRKALLPPAPRVSPRGVVALARGLVTVLQN